MAKYEMLYLLNNDATDEAKAAEIEKYETIVKSMNGFRRIYGQMGNEKACVSVKFKNEAYYVLMTFEADGKVVNELDRVAGIDGEVLRRMITKLN